MQGHPVGVSLLSFPREMPFTKWGVAHGMTGHTAWCGDLALLPDLILNLHHRPAHLAFNEVVLIVRVFAQPDRP
jgi:hypothetical protein